MNKLSKLLLVLMLAAFVGATAARAQDKNAPAPKKEEQKEEKSAFVGKWALTIAAPGQDLNGTMTIAKEGDKYLGVVATVLGEAPLTNVKIDGKKLVADISVNAQGQQMNGTFTADLDGDAVKGEINLAGFPAIPFNGKKQ
jgi:hypothetical protein